MADRYCRNKSHAELIKRVGTLVKSDIVHSQTKECEEWYSWVLVRNAVVHLGGEVSVDLAGRWPSRFPSPGSSLELTASDLNRVAYVARHLVATLDRRFMDTIVQTHDQMLLARELYVRYDIPTASALASRVSKTLGCRFGKNHAEQAIAEQKRSAHPESGITFTRGMLGEVDG